MWSFLFHRGKIRSTRKAEAERKYFQEADHFFVDVQYTDKPRRYERLDLLVNGAEFKEKVRGLRRFSWWSQKRRERWKSSEEYQALFEYCRLRGDKDLCCYLHLKKDPLFKEYRNWKMIFEDHFPGFCLDSSKWIMRYYAGELFLKDTYAVGKDVQLFMPGNVTVLDGGICLEFRKEEITGKYWDPKRGIVAGKYPYTSGLISTALSFRQGQGRFEAKINVNDSLVSSCFWLRGDADFPHINVMKIDKGYYDAGCFFKSEDEKAQKELKIKLKNGSYIFTLDWTSEEFIWKINDCVVKRQKNNVPDIPLYAVFSLGSTQNIPEKELPVQMNIEWVRFFVKYKEVKYAE